jgi:hypothetical protein
VHKNEPGQIEKLNWQYQNKRQIKINANIKANTKRTTLEGAVFYA